MRFLFIIAMLFSSPGEGRAETRASIMAEHQKVEELLRDIPSKAILILEKIAHDPVLLQNPDLHMKQIRLTLEYENRMKTFTQTPQLLEDGTKLLSEIHDPKAEIELLLGKANYAYELEKIEGMRTALSRAYELSIKIGDIESQAFILAEQGNLDRSELNYQAALIHYLQAFELVKERVETDSYGKVANALAIFYLEGLAVRYDQGIKILEGLVKVAESSAKPRRQDLQIFMSNLGFAYSRKGQLDKARETFERAVQLAIAIEDWTGMAYCQTYIGSVLVKEKKWQEALRYFTTSQNYFIKTKNQSMVQRNAQRIMSVQLELGDHKSAAANWKIVQTETEKNLPLDLRVEHNRLRGRLATMEGRWKEAYEAFEQMNRLESKLNAQKNADSARYYTALFNIERKEQENRRLEQRGRVQVLQLDNNRKQSEVLSWILISATVIAMIFAVDFFRVRKRRKKIQDLTENVQKNLLQRYLPPQTVQAVLAGRQNLDSSPQQKRVTLIHAELCDFTRAVELLGPLRIGRILNIYLTEMMEIIGNEGGMIDRFVNGSIVGVFGGMDERSAAQQAEAVVRCARLIQARLEELNRNWQKTEGWAFALRVGLHQGDSLVGLLGVEPRIDYCVTGPVVESVGQVCSRGAPGETMVSGSLAPFLDPQNLSSVSRLRPGSDGEVYTLLRASA